MNDKKQKKNNIVDQLAQVIIDDLNGERKRYIFPISQIDGLNVGVSLQMGYKSIIFKIHDLHWRRTGEEGELYLENFYLKSFDFDTKEKVGMKDCKGILMIIQDILSSIRFSTFEGQFVTMDKNDETELLFKEFISTEKVVWAFDECCVCLKMTKTKTGCNHYLCCRCYQKLKKTKCPMCREQLGDYRDSDDDEDES